MPSLCRCREEHKKENLEVPVNFAEFPKKCSQRWKIMSAKDKSKFDEKAKAFNVPCDQETKDYEPANGGKKKDPNASKRPLSGFFLVCSEFHPKIKSTNPGVSIGDMAKKLGEMWNNLSDSKKQPYNNKAASLKEAYEKDGADYISLKASLMAQRVLVKLSGKRSKKMKKKNRKKRKRRMKNNNFLKSSLSVSL